MSRFGVDLNDWVTLDFASQNDKIILFVNGEEAINLPLVGKINRFYGFVFRFEDIGSVRKLRLSNSKRNYLDLDYIRGHRRIKTQILIAKNLYKCSLVSFYSLKLSVNARIFINECFLFL